MMRLKLMEYILSFDGITWLACDVGVEEAIEELTTKEEQLYFSRAVGYFFKENLPQIATSIML